MSKTDQSILTTAMQNADKMKEKIDTEAAEITEKITSRKKLIRNAILGVAAGSILTYIAVKLSSSESEDEATSTED